MSQFIRFAAGVITGVVAVQLIKNKKTQAEASVEPSAEKKTAPKQEEVGGSEEKSS